MGLNLNWLMRSTGKALRPLPKNRISSHHPTQQVRAMTYIGKLTVILSTSSLLEHIDLVTSDPAGTNTAFELFRRY